ncbi:hypothetical protein [Carboxylicivirga linearis]|uniref:Uncharacterized protein n=1 Tax=Carboxylicivirga linearis TaxID=1628157 RepID=A0ABS5JW54_9BACT|nr:hypothetical protein [Carboxylicivirga linearis]MBS2099135.1 hypothetical protein [Carboxylicivirga linearis]
MDIKMSLKQIVEDLAKEFGENKYIQGLIQLVSVGGIPFGPAISASVVTAYNNYLSQKMRIFFKELNSGDIILNEDVIYNNDFLHAYFSTLNYVVNTRTDKRIIHFAKLLKSLYSHDLSIENHEEYSKILDEITDREFAMLVIKKEFEHSYGIMDNDKNEAQMTQSYWDVYVKSLFHHIDIHPDDVDSLHSRVQRTGCYLKFNGFFEDSPNQHGNTTAIFKEICNIVEEESVLVNT